MTLDEALEPGPHPAADFERALLEALVADHVEHREADLAGDGVAAEGVEVLHAVRERGRDRRSRHDRAERMPVADGLAQRHDVGDDVLALRLESPEMRPDAAEADLDFVGDAHGAGLAGVPVGRREVARRQLDLPSAGEEALAEEGRDAAVARGLGDVGGEFLGRGGDRPADRGRGSRRASGRRACGRAPAGPIRRGPRTCTG